MTNVVLFPQKLKQCNAADTTPAQSTQKRNWASSFVISMLTFLRTTLVLLWPFIKWFVYLDLLLSFLKMSLHTNNHATYDFILHCSIIFLGVIFVFFYTPKRNITVNARKE
ncbi:MAG: hypothetical protein LEGION0403_FIIPPAGN_02409 [Legionella sp.]|uniref:KleE stable inheritance protein n=1 Tax=Legionella sp. TaxID=459 RepID=UPI003D12CAE9